MKREEVKKALGENATDEQIQAVMDLHQVDVEAHKVAIKAKDDEIGKLQTQANETQEALKKFDGEDIEGYKAKISELTTQLETQKTSFETEKAEREFNEWFNGQAKGVKSIKALRAEFGEERISKLRESKNRDEDYKSLFEEVTKEATYLLEDEEPINNPVGATGSGDGGKNIDAARAVMGLPPLK